MRFDFTPEQKALKDSVVRLFAVRAERTALRALWESETGRDAKLWEGLSELGIPAILVPEEYDGFGGDEVDLCRVLEESGRYCVPDALLESVFLAPAIIALTGSAEQKSRWLPKIAAGELRVTVALRHTQFVPDAHVSDLIILERDGGLTAYTRAEVEIERVTVMDPSRRVFTVEPKPGSGSTLNADPIALAAIHARQDVGLAAVLNGLSAGMIDMTVEYVKVRKQFNRTIGSFQAVKHQLAQASSYNALALQAARSSIYRVAHDEPNAADSSRLARICAIEAEFESNRVALQLHGGIGFTWEHDLQFWLKRGKALEQAYGTHRSTLAAAGAAGLEPSPANAF